MSEGNSEKKLAEQAPEAVVQTKRSFSIIWVVPIIALLIGGWLTFKAMTEKGPVDHHHLRDRRRARSGQDQDQVQGCRSRQGHGHHRE